MSLNDDIVYIEKDDGICFPTFVVGNFSGLVLHQSNFSIIISIWINNKSCFIESLVLIKL